MAPHRLLPTDVEIRPGEPDDVPLLRQFRCANEGEPWTVAPEVLVSTRVPAWIGRVDTTVLVAEAAGQLVGVIALHRDPSEAGTWVSEVLAVVPERRREHIGFNLKLAALQLVVFAGGTSVVSEVDEHNVAMRRCNDCFQAATAASAHDHELLLTAVRLGEP